MQSQRASLIVGTVRPEDSGQGELAAEKLARRVASGPATELLLDNSAPEGRGAGTGRFSANKNILRQSENHTFGACGSLPSLQPSLLSQLAVQRVRPRPSTETRLGDGLSSP